MIERTPGITRMIDRLEAKDGSRARFAQMTAAMFTAAHGGKEESVELLTSLLKKRITPPFAVEQSRARAAIALLEKTRQLTNRIKRSKKMTRDQNFGVRRQSARNSFNKRGLKTAVKGAEKPGAGSEGRILICAIIRCRSKRDDRTNGFDETH